MSLTSESGEWSTYITPSSIETASPPFNSYTSPFSSFTLQPSLQGASASFSAPVVSSLESLPAMTVTVCGLGSIFEMVRACAGAAQSKVVTPSVATPIDLMPIPPRYFGLAPIAEERRDFVADVAMALSPLFMNSAIAKPSSKARKGSCPKGSPISREATGTKFPMSAFRCLVTETGHCCGKEGHGGRRKESLKSPAYSQGPHRSEKDASHGAYRYRDGHSGFGIIWARCRDHPRDDLAHPDSSHHSAASAIRFRSYLRLGAS